MKTRSDLETANENLPENSGGAERDRTVDPLLAKQVLSQLSYSPLARIIVPAVEISGGPG